MISTINTQNINNELFDDKLKLLNYYQNEYIYRHTHFWNILIKLFVFDIVVAIMPFISGIFGITISNKALKYNYGFPIIAIVISIVSLWILCEEGTRIRIVGREIGKILVSIGKTHNNRKANLSRYLPYIVCGVEIIISMIVIMMIV